MSPRTRLRSWLSNPARTPAPRPRTLLAAEQLESRDVPSVYPNDPGFAEQWALHNTGQTGGLSDADIDAPAAWSVTTGSMATVVAILDSGIDFSHPDLYLNIWLNQGEIPAATAASLVDADGDTFITFRDLNAPANAAHVTDVNGTGYIDGGDLLNDPRWENGLDEDGNGKADDLVGWDFYDNDNDPRDFVDTHGTDKSLIIGGMANNGFGGAGVAWSVRMLPVRIKSGADVVNAKVVAGLDYAVASGAPISYQGWRGNPQTSADAFSQEIYDALDRARQAGQLVVTGAGNGSRDSDALPWYPGAYNLDNIIVAAALDDQNQLSSLTNWGATSVDLGVPAYGGATSNSLAITTGVASLLKSMHPNWNYAQIKAQLMATVDPLPSLAGKSVTGGRLNAAKALGVVYSTKFYVLNDATTDRTHEYDGSGETIEDYPLNSGNTAPRGAASTVAGDKVWVVDANKTVYVYTSAGTLLGSWAADSLAGNATVEGITVWGNDVWLVDARQDRVYRFAGAATRLSGSQNATSNFALNNGNKDPKDLVTDGTSIWMMNDSTIDKVFKYTLSGSLLGNWTMTGGGGSPTGITLDPTGASQDLWVVDNATDRVYQFADARSRTSGSQSAASTFDLAAGNTNPQGIADPPAPTGAGNRPSVARTSVANSFFGGIDLAPAASDDEPAVRPTERTDVAWAEAFDEAGFGCGWGVAVDPSDLIYLTASSEGLVDSPDRLGTRGSVFRVKLRQD